MNGTNGSAIDGRGATTFGSTPVCRRTRCTVVWWSPSWPAMVPIGHFSPWNRRTISASVSLEIIAELPHGGGPRGTRGTRRRARLRQVRPDLQAQGGSIAPQTEQRSRSRTGTSSSSFPPAAIASAGDEVLETGASVTV
jgi:hypothetical protein